MRRLLRAAFTLSGWCLGVYALYVLGVNGQRAEVRERTFWEQLDRYQRMITPHQGFDIHGNVVRDDTNGDTEPIVDSVPRAGGLWGENLAGG